MAGLKLEDLRVLAEKSAKDALGDLGEYGDKAALLAQQALTLQIWAATQKALGFDTTLVEKSVAAAYYNLAVGSQAKLARKVNKVFKDFMGAAVGVLFDAAGLPKAAPKSTPGDKT